MMMMGHSLAPSRLKMRDLLAAFASFLHSADWSKSCLDGECRYNGRSEKQDYPFLFVDKKMRRKSVTKVLLGHFQAYFFLCLLYLCFVFKGLKSYYILPKTLLCSYFNVVMVLYAMPSFYTGVWGTYMIVKPSKKDHLCYYISTDFYIHFHFNAVKMQNWNCNTALRSEHAYCIVKKCLR